MKKLVHPNVVQLVEVIDAPRDRSLYMVMEYAERGAAMRCVEPGMGRYECPVNGENFVCGLWLVVPPTQKPCK